MMKMAIALAMMLVLTAAVAYVDRSAVARVEFQNQRHAMKVERASRAALKEEAGKQQAEHEKDLASANRKIEALEASAARKLTESTPAPKTDPFCRPGCRIK